MARKDQLAEARKRKLELIDELDASRIAITVSRDLLKDSCNVKKRVGRSLAKHRNKWMIGSIVGGVAVSTLLNKGRKKTTEKKSVGGWLKGLVMGVVIRKAKSIAIEKARVMVIKKIQERNQYE